jgi:hypothetical protein
MLCRWKKYLFKIVLAPLGGKRLWKHRQPSAERLLGKNNTKG